VFTASGGSPPFKWSVGNDVRGHVEPQGSLQGLYTRLTDGNNTVQAIDGVGHIAIADIAQPAVPTLAISPTVVNVSSNGGTQVFNAVGGAPPYLWEVQTPASGTLGPPPLTDGSSKIYTSTGSGTDIIILRDAAANIVFATINKN
jgi:hypothetical protein